ncbi:M48 family metalloprotease [Litoreibacter roseus]|uniref:Peptidase M48 n=1 Tax=Litoreibacter roseus TaxID=2601869 RepID=A0A6N6JD88_9RHOB|nr:M48 family metalloprotease [Litoreibacter roseus]GFE64136.1 peptidase M48 [Litoreibacter roseus]
MLKRLTLSLFLMLFCAVPAYAASLIRDAEIEYALRKIAQPILQAAGMGSNRIRILVINDPSLNAFVADSRHVFVHSGLIMKLSRPEALQAVLAHEFAHIANGHLTLRASNLRAASTQGAIGLALAAAAALAGEGQAAGGLAAGTASTAQRVFFSHTRAEEASADQSALRYMARAGLDPDAMSDVLNLFRGQEALRPGRQDPYALTHPLSRDRLRAVKGFAASQGSAGGEASAETVYWFNRMDAKLKGFLRNANYVLRRKESKGNSETAILRRAIAYHRTPKPKKALSELERLLAMRPRDPFYHELRGQVLLESGNVGAAVQSYRNALALAPNEALIMRGLGRAYLAADSADANRAALSTLEKARTRDSGDPGMLRDLAVAHARVGQNGLASVATAERYAIIGRYKDAELHAKRASGALPRGSSGWLRAQDVLIAAKSAKTRRR